MKFWARLTSFALHAIGLQGSVSAMENGDCSVDQATAVSPYCGLGAVREPKL